MKRASQDQDLRKILKEMASHQAQYPEELYASRRAAFLDQLAQSPSTAAQAEQQPALQEQKIIEPLKQMGSVPAPYPSRLLAARRAAFVRRIAWLNFVSMCTAVWLIIQNRILTPVFRPRTDAQRRLPAFALVASMGLAAFAGYLVYANQASLPQLVPTQTGTIHSGRILTSDAREVRIICKPGAQPPLCLAGEYKRDDGELTYQGNGSARPAVAKDTMTGQGDIHKAAYINDGLYGPGASWISNSRNSWIKIDLGKATKINTVTFGRDRLGKLNGHNPGQFVVSLALSDDKYANGNNNNDNQEYQSVFNSDQAGFSGTIDGAETVTAQFNPQVARYIKITFENKGAAIDEVEAFMAQPPVASGASDPDSRDKPKDSSTSPASKTAPPSVTVTSLPENTATSVPTLTMVPSETATSMPTATSIPTNTDVPTSTAIPTTTMVPSNTPTPAPSNTPLPPPTNTPVPPATTTPGLSDPPTQASMPLKVDNFDYQATLPSP
jgi:hypothetical protein